MGALRCVDGSVLTVVAVVCHDQTGTPYEITLDLRRGRKPFASVGERCGFRLSQLAASVTAAREDPQQAAAWPDPDDRFPEPGPQCGERAGGGLRSGEREDFSLPSPDPSGLPGSGECRPAPGVAGGEQEGGGRARAGQPGRPGEAPWRGARLLPSGITNDGREASLPPRATPRRCGVGGDATRRWARSAGLADVSSGHQA